MHTEIPLLEERLRAAMLTGNVAELDLLIDDRLLFIGPDGRVYGKQEDLELHRSGAEQITRADFEEIRVEAHGLVAISTVRARMAGVFRGAAFEGEFRYIRTWLRGEHGWRIIAGSVSAVPA